MKNELIASKRVCDELCSNLEIQKQEKCYIGKRGEEKQITLGVSQFFSSYFFQNGIRKRKKEPEKGKESEKKISRTSSCK